MQEINNKKRIKTELNTSAWSRWTMTVYNAELSIREFQKASEGLSRKYNKGEKYTWDIFMERNWGVEANFIKCVLLAAWDGLCAWLDYS